MGTTSTVVKLVGISAIVPGLAPIGMGLVVAGAFHPDSRRAIDGGVETGSRHLAALGRTAARQAGRAYLLATAPERAPRETAVDGPGVEL